MALAHSLHSTAPGSQPPPEVPSSLGVEEEFFLVNAASGRPEPRAADVLALVGGPEAARYGAAQLKRELFASQIEAASGICSGLDELAADLSMSRQRLARAAGSLGLRLISTGTPGTQAVPCTSSGEPRYEQIVSTFGEVALGYEVCGCHVHVSVPDHETAVAIVNHLRPWLPSLLALSVNSPFFEGKDTGYGSWRTIQQSRFPVSGIPPYFSSAAAYDRAVETLVDCGAVLDIRMNYWLARPSPNFPTVELRTADAALTMPDSLLQAALSRALVRTARRALEAGREAEAVDGQVCAAALWSAARYGLSGPGVRTGEACRAPATDLVRELLETVAPALEETGDLARVRRLLNRVLTHGTGAERQRAAAAHHGGTGRRSLVGFLARETLAPAPEDVLPAEHAPAGAHQRSGGASQPG